MQRYIAHRILQAFVTVIVVTWLVFGLLHIVPGDPLLTLMGEDWKHDEETLAFYRQKFGLDRPLPVQWAIWMGGVLKGDFGRATYRERPVGESMKRRIGVTAQLVLFSKLISLSIALPVGLLSGLRRGSWVDHFSRLFAVAGVGLPSFWMAILLILLFAVTLGWLPAAGYVPLSDDPLQWLKSMIMPAFVLGTHGAATMTRQLRSSVIEVLRQDYIRTARAKGLTERRVALVHVLKIALLPVASILGITLGRAVGGSVIVETIFAIPGMGAWMIESITMRDFPVVQAVLLVVAVAVLFANLLTDLAYAYLDPRISYR